MALALAKRRYSTVTATRHVNAEAGEADNVSSVSASACHIGGPIGVNPGELTLVYGTTNMKGQKTTRR